MSAKHFAKPGNPANPANQGAAPGGTVQPRRGATAWGEGSASGDAAGGRNAAPAAQQSAQQPDPYGWGPSPYDAQSNPYASAGSQDPFPGAGAQNPYTDAGAQNPYASPYTPPVQDDNVYVDGPSSGAVNVMHEHAGHVDPLSRENYHPSKKRGRRSRGSGDDAAADAPVQPESPYAAPKRRSHKPVAIAVLVVLGLLAGVGLYLWQNPPFYSVTINGATQTVDAGSTLQTAIDKGYASPQAGDLIAVDGSVATPGGGDPFEATVNGASTTDPTAPLPRNGTVEFQDGNDVNETYTEATETIPHDTSGGTDVNSTTAYWAGSIHVCSEGEDGERVTRTGDVSGKTVTKVTKQPVAAGYHVYSANTNGDKVIALTFDDGPWPTTTSEILDILKENDAKATFFEIGNQVAENADVVKRIHAEGHQIGSHTWDHASGSGRGVDLTRMTADEQVQEVEKGFQAIEDTLGTQVNHVLRAPGGNYHGEIIGTLKDKITAEIGWDVDTEDWRKPGAAAIERAILSAKPGNVVLMHDGGGDRSETVEALKAALPQLKAQGYKFVTIDELMSTYGTPSSD